VKKCKTEIKRWLLAVATILVFVLIKIFGYFLPIDLPKQVQDFITLSLGVIIEALPFVMLGLFFSIIVRLWLPHDWLLKYLPKQPFLRRALISLLGVFMPVCECGNVPLARGLLAKGLTPAESLTFLLAAPILNPVTIITTQQAFSDDNTVLIARILGGFLIANLIGWIYSSTRQDAMLRPEFIAICKEKKDNSNRLVDALHFFKHETRSMMPALVIGAMVAGLIQVVVPRETILLLGNSPAWSVLVMAVLAFVVSICSSVDAFFALAFRGSFTSGSLVSFLTFGPMIDVKMLSLMRTTYRRNILLQVSVLVFLMSMLIGLVVNYVF
jgi:uncharacterized protein